MKDSKIKFKLENWHFYLLGIVLVNFGIGYITGYRLNQNVTFVLKVVIYLTGMFLFFKSLRPFKLKAVYYIFYPITVAVTGLLFFLGGIFLAVLATFLLYPIFPSQTEYKAENIIIYNRFQGFMSSGYSYEVVEPKFYIFEKHLGYINTPKPIDAEKDEFILMDNKIIYKYELENYKYDNQTDNIRDTIVILNFR